MPYVVLALALPTLLSATTTTAPIATSGRCIPTCASLRELMGPLAEDELRRLAEAIRPRIAEVNSATRKVQILNVYLFHELGFRGDGSLDSREALLPESVLERRSGYCVGLATICLALAGELGLPVKGVATPSHLFVRYDDGRNRINIELLNAGMTFDDSWYMRQYHIPVSAIKHGIFLRNLTEHEVLGYVYANLGTLYSKVGDFRNSRVLYEAALRECPQLPAAYYNLGNDLLGQGDYRQAVKNFSRALRLYPTDLWALNNRGLAFCKAGKIRRAQKDFGAAVALDPSFTMAVQNLSTLECGGNSPAK